MSPKVENTNSPIKKHTLLVIFFLIFVWFALPLTTFVFSKSVEKSAQIGDSFNVVTSLFSGAALVGVIYTILLQQREMRDTRMAQNEEIRQSSYTTRLQALQFLIQNTKYSIKEAMPGLTVPSSLNELEKLASEFESGGRYADESVENAYLVNNLLELNKEIWSIYTKSKRGRDGKEA